MQTLVLPGYSCSNREWAYEVQKNLAPEIVADVHEWRHWKTNTKLNINFEVGKILAEVDKTEVNFIAKSVGTRVLMSVIPKLISKINKVILCGIPVDPINYTKALSLVESENILIFQNTKDPFMPGRVISMYMKLLNKKIKVIEKEAASHDYPYFTDFKRFLR